MIAMLCSKGVCSCKIQLSPEKLQTLRKKLKLKKTLRKVITILSIIMFFFKTSATANYEKKIYDFSIESITGETINFKEYKNKILRFAAPLIYTLK